MKPLGNRVFVKPDEEKEEKSEGGLVLVGKRNPFLKGTITEVSPDIEDPKVNAGDRVLYGEGSGTDVDGILVMDYSRLVAVLDPES